MPERNDEKEDKRLTSFLQELRHEINTPLSVIKGYTELIEEKFGATMDPELKRYLQVIMKNIERLEASTETIMTREFLREKD